MPELPEVENLAAYLQQVLPNRQILEVTVGRAKSVRPDPVDVFQKRLSGARFQSVSRRAKFLLFRMKRGREAFSFFGHLGMTGRMYVQGKRVSLPKHLAVAMTLDRGCFVFEDMRCFGRLGLGMEALENLGPEPLSDAFDPVAFWQGLQRSRQAVKVRLLSPDLVVGVGNIYASEALFRARIDPRTPAMRLSRGRAARLHKSIRETLQEAIQLGSSLSLDWSGKGQRDQLFYFGGTKDEATDAERFWVYGREGEDCRACGRGVTRLVQAARSTFACFNCQR